MLVCEVALMVFVVGLTNAQYNEDRYVVPDPKIEAFIPKGFRVSIEDSPGIRLFAFHGNINKKIRDLEAGTFSRDILRKQNGRWTFEDHNTQLHIGDTINYWLFVIKDGLGYRLDDGSYKIKELIQNTPEPSGPLFTSPVTEETIIQQQVQTEVSINEQLGPAITSPPLIPSSGFASPSSSAVAAAELPSVANGFPSRLGTCEQNILNVTDNLITLQSQISMLIKTNQQLMTLLQSLPDAKKLTLSGRVPPDGEASMTASFLLREKLDINPTIMSAVRNTDGSITFEVRSVDQKLNILEMAKQKLRNSKIIVT